VIWSIDRSVRTGRPTAAADEDRRPGRQHHGPTPLPRSADPDALRPSKPRQTDEAQNGGDVEVQAQPEQVLGGVDAQELLEDPKARVSGDVEGEQPRRSHLAALPEPD
jgi:hypothetical protein